MSHYNELKAELATIPAHDTQERAAMERRIQAVFTATVGGKKYTGPNMVGDIYKDLIAESHKLKSAKFYAEGSPLRQPSETFIQLDDLARQYDPYGVGKDLFLVRDIHTVKRDPRGGRNYTLSEDAYPMVTTQAALHQLQDHIKAWRKEEPNSKTAELAKHAYTMVDAHQTSVEDDQKFRSLFALTDEYRKTLKSAVQSGDIELQVTGGKKIKRADEDTYEPLFTASFKTDAGRKTITQLLGIEERIAQVSASASDKETSERLKGRAAADLEDIKLDTAQHHIYRNKDLSKDDQNTLINSMFEKAKKLYEKGAKKPMSQATPAEQDPQILALTEAFHSTPLPAGTQIPHKTGSPDSPGSRGAA